METVTIRDVNDPGYERKVSLRSFNLWPKSKEINGARMAQGKRHMVIVGEEAGDKVIAERTAPRIPEVVERVLATSKDAAAEAAPAEVVEAPKQEAPAVEAPKPAAKPAGKPGPKAKK